MNYPVSARFPLAESWWRGIILALSGAVILFTLWCLANGITTIFMHLYYFPIVLLAYHYRWKGCGLATLLALIYLGLSVVFDASQPDVILGALYRFFVFVGIAAVIAYLSENLAQAHITLQQSAELRDRYLSLAPAIVLALDRNGAITYLNRHGAEILQCIPEDALGKPWFDQFLPEKERARVNGIFSQLMAEQGEQNRIIENRVLTCGGAEKIIRWHNTVLTDEKGQITGILGFGEDITEEKWRQDTLREMQQFQESVITNANVWISVLEPDGTLLVWNDAAEAISGYKKTGVLGKRTVWKQLYPDKEYRKKVTGEIQRIIGRDTLLEDFETEIRCADGTKKTIVWNTRGLRNTKDAITSYIAIGRDVTAQKTAEAETRLTTMILKTQQEASPDGILIVDESGKILSFNRRFIAIWDIPRPVIDLRSDERALAFVLDKLSDPQEFLARVRYLYEHREEKSREEILLKDGRVFERYSAPMLGEDNRYFGRVWYFHDVTESKRVEEVIRSREEQFRAIFHNQQTGLLMVDAETHTIADANTAAVALIGATRDEIIGKICHTFICPAEKGKCPVTDLNQTVDNSERILIRANGEKIPILKSVNPIKIGGRPFLIESFVDLTERKQMEEQIQESRQLFADIISFLPDPTFVVDNEGKVLAWNRALEQLSGVPAPDIIGKGDHEYTLWIYGKRRPILIDLVLHPEQDADRLHYTDIHWEGLTVTAQTEFTPPGGGHMIALSLVASPLIGAEGRITGAIESLRDISRLREAEAELARINQDLEKIVWDRTRALEDEVAQRRRAENEVQDALRYTRSVFEANPDLMVVLDRNGTVLDVNAAAEVLTGIPKEQVIGTPYSGYLVDDGTLSDTLSRLIESGSIENLVRIRHTSGHTTPLAVNATMIGGKDAPDARIIVAAHDITRQKKDEEAIRASLDEKVLLLREVHHRVKNNLQIIISLVNLQMRQTDDPVVKKIMSETQNRVRAMSLVHEKLYRSDNLSRIDFADYTRFLTTQLFSFYGMDTQRVRLEFAMDEIMVDIDTAVPLGLLMNELISNVLKHAFPHGRKGAINISGRDDGHLITLVVRDDGIGIPADLDWKNTSSLGMRLVTSLIDQVDGTITLDRSSGSSFTITVRRKPSPGDVL